MHSLLRDKECHGRHSYKTIRTNTMQLTNKRQERNDCLRDDSIKQEELLVAFFLVMCARADGAESFCDDALARRRCATRWLFQHTYTRTLEGGVQVGVKNNLAIIIVHHCTFLSLVALLVEPCLHNHRLKIPLCHLINLSHQKRL